MGLSLQICFKRQARVVFSDFRDLSEVTLILIVQHFFDSSKVVLILIGEDLAWFKLASIKPKQVSEQAVMVVLAILIQAVIPIFALVKQISKQQAFAKVIASF